MLTKRELSNWEKKHGQTVCIYCRQPAGYDDSDFSLTKRKTLIGWHKECYLKRYHPDVWRAGHGK